MKVTVSENVIVTDDSAGTVWTLPPDQVEKHRPMFGADFDAAPKAQRDKLAALVAADAMAVKAGA